MADAVADRPRAVTVALFVGKVIQDDKGNEQVIDQDTASAIHYDMIINGYIDRKGILTDKYYEDKANGELKVAEEVADSAASVIEIVDSVYDARSTQPENARSNNVELRVDEDKLAIFDMTISGMGAEQIATKLEADNVLTPTAYWIAKGVRRPGRGQKQPPTHWSGSSVIHILTAQEYCGDIINFKTYSKSYKLKRRIDNAPENWAIFKDVHTPIIERAVWEKVQEKRGQIRKRKNSQGQVSMFSGLLVCADCGCNLHYHFNQGNPEIRYFNCSNYKGNRGTCTSTHYIRVDFLEQVVLGEIRRLTKFASKYETLFAQAVMGCSRQNAETERETMKKEVYALQARNRELDVLFEKLYEDNVAGKITDERFARMSQKYEAEQHDLTARIKELKDAINKSGNQSVTADMFISTVRKYTRAKKLTPRMLNELIQYIEVHQAEKVDGVWEQKLTLHYNCVGVIDIPAELPSLIPMFQ